LSTSGEVGQTPGAGLATAGTHPGADGDEGRLTAAVAGAVVAGAGRRVVPAGDGDGGEVGGVVEVMLAQPLSRTAPPRVNRARRE
jgi:hypothetical protein